MMIRMFIIMIRMFHLKYPILLVETICLPHVNLSWLILVFIMMLCQPQLSHSSHCSIYLFSWCICHPDGHMKSCKSWFNFPTTLLSSSHYIAQWILMSLICLWKPNQILKPALPSLSLPYHANIFTYSILVSLTSSWPSVHHIHSLRSLLLFPF